MVADSALVFVICRQGAAAARPEKSHRAVAKAS